MNKTFYITLVASCIMAACFIAHSQTIYMKHYTTNDGLAGNHVYMCHQDNNGYLWIATTSGLSRFDGKKFKNYDYDDGLQDNEVLFVTNDADNNIWVNTFSGLPVLSVIRNDNINHNQKPNISSISTKGISLSDEYYSAKTGKTYINGKNTLAFINKSTITISKYTGLIPSSPYFETEDSKIFSGDGYHICTINDTIVSVFQSLHLDTPFTKLCYYGGMMYAIIGNTVKLYHYNASGFHYSSTVRFKSTINLMHVNQFGVWITFADQKGVNLYRDKNINIQPSQIIIPGLINYFTNDAEGGMWISTTDNGIFFLPDPNMISYTANDGLASSVVYSIDPISADRFWLGYNTGKATLIKLYNNRVETKRAVSFGEYEYSNNFVLGVVHNNNNTFLLSRTKLLRLRNNQLTTIPTTTANKSLLLINDTLLGIGAWSFELLNLKTMQRNIYKTGRTYAQAVDKHNNIWIGSINGVYHLSSNKATAPDKIRGLDNIKINALAIAEPYIWAGSQNNGLYLIKNDSLVAQFTYKNVKGLPSNTIKALAIKNNTIWIGTNRGIMYTEFDYSSLRFKNTLIIDHNDGLLSPEINTIKIVDSIVFIATYEGVTILNKPRHKKLNYTVSDIFINPPGRESMRGDSIVLPYSTKGLEIGFHAAAFKYNSEMTYRYKLHPFDNEWKTTKNNLVQYTNIPPGSYHLYLAVYDNRGNYSSTTKSIYIQVNPLYWQTVCFKILLVFLLLLLISFLLLGYYMYNKKRTLDKLTQGKLIAKAKLEALRAQLKPHFIFNSLNAIKDFIYNNKNDAAADLLQGFAGLIRKGLNLADRDFITIYEEAAFLKQYLELEQAKCDYCFDFRFDVSEKIANIVIPSLITQPFVENAVIHGIRSVKNKKAVLLITYSLIDNDVVCCIADNGIGIKQSLLHKKIEYSKGTAISKDRISYFKTGLGIDILLDVQDRAETQTNTHGTIVTITIKNATQYIKP